MLAPFLGMVGGTSILRGLRVGAKRWQTHRAAQLLQRSDAVAYGKQASAPGRARPVLAAVQLAAGSR